jgi:predicted O-methyltransferase YrrM
MTFIEKFDQEFAPKLGRRAHTMRAIVSLLKELPSFIVETGTLRQENNWEGDGQSTLIWDAYVNHVGGKVISIDYDPFATKIAKRLVSNKTEIICSDSIIALRKLQLKNTIDLLYLDSMDAHLPESGKHHMFELIQVWSSLKPGAIIAIDDVLSENAGKHVLIERFMYEMGYKPVVKGYQIVWTT